MKSLIYLLIALGVMIAIYVVYRYTFLVKPKPKHKLPPKPNFTLKIEPEI